MDTGLVVALGALGLAVLGGRRAGSESRGGPMVATQLEGTVTHALAMVPPAAGLVAGQLLGLRRVQAIGVGKPWSEGPLKLVRGVQINPLTWWGLLATARGKFRVILTHRQGTDPVQAFMATPLYQELKAAARHVVNLPVLGEAVALGTIESIVVVGQ